jgi:hypothetical protein
MGDGIPLPIAITSTSTTTNTKTTRHSAKYPHFPVALCQSLYEWYVICRGAEDFASFRKALSPFFPSAGPMFTEAELRDAIQAFGEVAGSQQPQYSNSWHVRKMAGDMGTWVRLGKMPKQTPTGELTERGRLIAA